MNFLGTINVYAGTAESTQTAARGTLDLSTKTADDDTVLEAVTGGSAGNSITIAMVADSVAGVSIAVVPAAKTVVIHFQDGVSTVANVETAIAALAGANKIVRTKTTGTGATVLHAVTDEFAATPLAGGVTFLIPEAVKRLFFQSDTDGVQFELGTGASFATTAARGAFIVAGSIPQGPFNTGGTQPVVSIWNPTAGTAKVNVYAAPAS